MSEKAPLLELKKVSKSFISGGKPLTILNELDLTIYIGETVAITGPSGSGKSTLLGLLAGLDTLSAGEIFLEGTPIHNWNEDQRAAWRRTQVGFVFQDFRLVPSFTAIENISLPLEILGTDAQEAEQKAKDFLDKLGLSERGHHYPHQLSGGEQQRVAIGRAYAHQPKLIFADEPTGNLDPKTSEQVLKSLMTMIENTHTTLALVTHDMELAETMERHVSLKNGRIEQRKS